MEKDLTKFLQDLEVLKKFRPGAWVIKSDGLSLVLSSGKSVWRKKNHAGSAFVNHISTMYSYRDIEKFGFKNGREMAHYIIQSGIVTIEEI